MLANRDEKQGGMEDGSHAEGQITKATMRCSHLVFPLQRQVSAVMPRFPRSPIISGQRPLQVGHGCCLFEVNDRVGVRPAGWMGGGKRGAGDLGFLAPFVGVSLQLHLDVIELPLLLRAWPAEVEAEDAGRAVAELLREVAVV